MNNAPELSVIMVTPDNYDTLEKAIGYICKQSVHKQIELVIVAPKQAHVEVKSSQLKALCGYRLVELDDLHSYGTAKAAGVQAAGAPVISFIEEHVYTDPGWAEALIARHQSSWAVVGPVVRNANPNNLTSWADFIITYGQWMEPLSGGPIDILPGNNSSYKRDILLSYGHSLGKWLEVEAMLYQHLIDSGYQIYLEPKAIIHHLGFSKLFASLPVQFHVGRLFAAGRAIEWPRFKKIIYVFGSPIIPLLKLYRFTQKLIQSGDERKCPYAALPLTLFGTGFSAAGELMGYALGYGDSKYKILKHEFHRVTHL